MRGILRLLVVLSLATVVMCGCDSSGDEETEAVSQPALIQMEGVWTGIAPDGTRVRVEFRGIQSCGVYLDTNPYRFAGYYRVRANEFELIFPTIVLDGDGFLEAGFFGTVRGHTITGSTRRGYTGLGNGTITLTRQS
jgi:hypothetical protein